MENSTYNRLILQKGFLSLLMVLFCLVARAQPSDTLKGLAADTLVFTSVQHPPEFEGGMNEFYKFLGTNLRYPVNARTHHVQGRVILSMIVEKDGSISHTKVIRGVTEDIDKEALRVLKASPKWKPGFQNGTAVRVFYMIPISFKLG